MNDDLEKELLNLIEQSEKLNATITEKKEELIEKVNSGAITLFNFTLVSVKTRDYSECGHPEYNAMMTVFTNAAAKIKEFKDKISRVEKYLNNITDKSLYTDKKTNTVVSLQAPIIISEKQQLRKK